MNDLTTGNMICDQMMQVNIFGNMIPPTWYKTITRESTGKPYAYAILILADIVYWYRPRELRDEQTGALVGFQKRFAADLLQRSYQQIADQLGITKRDATNAIIALEHLGVIRREFRTILVKGARMNNVLFLDLDVSVLKKLTFPESEKSISQQLPPITQIGDRGINGCKVTPVPEISDRCHSNRGQPVTQIGETNTETTNTETTTYLSIHARAGEDDGLTDHEEQKVMDQVDVELPAPPTDSKVEQLMGSSEPIEQTAAGTDNALILNLVNEDLPKKILPDNPTKTETEVARLLTMLLPKMLANQKYKDQIESRIKTPADFYAWLSAAMQDYVTWAVDHKIKKPIAYLSAVLFNALETFRLSGASTADTLLPNGHVRSYDLDDLERMAMSGKMMEF